MILKRKGRPRKLFIVMILLCMCAAVLIYRIGVGRIGGGSPDRQAAFEYVALGDSIPNGYAASEDDNITAYPQLLAEHIEKEKGIAVNFLGYTKNGLSTGELDEIYLSDEKVQESIKRADLITVTIGANDILNKFRELYREKFSPAEVQDKDTQGTKKKDTQIRDIRTILKIIQREAADNQKLLGEAAKDIYGWDCDDFEKNWKKVMEHIGRNRKEGAKVIVTTIYNPVGEIKALGMMNQVIAALIDEMNEIITENAEAYGYQVAKLSEIRTEKYLQSDGLHPSQEGQMLIKERIAEGL